MGFELVFKDAPLGHELRGLDLSQPVSDAQFKEIEDTFDRYGVVVISGQKLKFMPTHPSRAPEKPRIRNSEKSNIGCSPVFSTSTKATKNATESPRTTSYRALVKPSSAPWVM